MTGLSRIKTRAEWTAAVQALHARAGLSYQVLAERCGTSTSTLQKMVTGQSFPRASTVRLFVRACGESDTQPWVDALIRVQQADRMVQRRRTPPGKQIQIGVIPRPADCYQGRDAFTRLTAAIEQHGTAVLTQVLAGMGGVGKTQLAAAYARHAWANGVGILVWANGSSRDGVISAYANAALRLGLQLADRQDQEQAAREFLAWADTAPHPWWLVVLDDVQNPGDLTGLWPPAATSAAGGEVVITTRLREAALSGADRRTINIDIFTVDEARSYLRAKLGQHADDITQIDGLAKDLGYLPLALAQAATYIVDQDLECAEYRRRLAARLLRRVFPQEQDLPDDHQRIISATWEMSLDQADQAEPIGLARPLLGLTSVLDPHGIPAAVLTSRPALDYLATYRPEIPHHQASNQRTVDEETADEGLRILHRFNLIDHDRTTTHREIRVHQMVQRATRENLASEPDIGSDLYAALVETAADALMDTWPAIERDHLGQVLRANASALHTVSGTILWQNDQIHPIHSRAASSLADAGQLGAAIAEYDNLHSISQQVLGPNHRGTWALRAQLAQWKGEAGDIEGAIAVFGELLADQLQILGPDDPEIMNTRRGLTLYRGKAGDVASAIADIEELLADKRNAVGLALGPLPAYVNDLAGFKITAGDTAGAISEYERLLAHQTQVDGPDDPSTLLTRHNLALARAAAGDITAAITALEVLLADQLRVLGPDHPQTLLTRHNLAAQRYAAGDKAGAAIAFEELLVDRLRVLGPDNPDTLVTRANLAAAANADDAHAAITEIRQVLADQQRVLSPNHPSTLITRAMLAEKQSESGDAEGAAAMLEELLADQLHVLGSDHPETMQTRGMLATWRGEGGDAAGAVTALNELLADQLRVLGPDHPTVLRTRGNLAVLQMRSDAEAATAAFEELLRDFVRLAGRDHPDVFATRTNMAAALFAAGDHPKAATTYEQLLDDQIRVLGPDHPDLLNTRKFLAYSRFIMAFGNGQAKPDIQTSAIDALRILLTEQSRLLGPDHHDTLETHDLLMPILSMLQEATVQHLESLTPDHPDLLGVRNQLVYLHDRAENAAGAADALEKLLADQLRILGPDHPDLLNTRHDLAVRRALAGDRSGATAAFEELLAECLRILGPDDPRTLDTQENLAIVRGETGDT